MSAFQVVVPQGVKGGDTIQVNTPDGAAMQTVVPVGLSAGQPFQVTVGTPGIAPIAAVPNTSISNTVRAYGALRLHDARLYSQSIPADQRKKPEGCYLIRMKDGCCIGATCHMECDNNCIWAPYCVLINSCFHVGACGLCYCYDGQDNVWHHDKKQMQLYDVDAETHTLACYHIPGDQRDKEPNPSVLVCCYCQPI